MTTLLKALAIGLRRGVARPGLLLAIWLVNVVVALPAAAVVTLALQESLGHSLAQENLRNGFDFHWYGEFQDAAPGIAATFTPALAGVGGLLRNLEAWAVGGLFRTHPGLVGLLVLYGLLWALLLGGILGRLTVDGGERGPAGFLRTGGSFFFRFLRLALLSAPLYWAIYRLHSFMTDRLENFCRDVTVERSVLFYSLLALSVTMFLLVLVHVCFAYAKIAAVVEQRRSMVLAAIRGVAFVWSHPGKTLGLYFVMALAGLALLAVYQVVAPPAGPTTEAGLWIAVAVGQMLLLARLLVRICLWAAQVSLYESVAGGD